MSVDLKRVARELAKEFSKNPVAVVATYNEGAIVSILRALADEVEELQYWNHSVRTCEDHASEMVGDGCLICDLEEGWEPLLGQMKRVVSALEDHGEEWDWHKCRNVIAESRDAIAKAEEVLK